MTAPKNRTDPAVGVGAGRDDGDVSRHTLDRPASLFGAAIGRRLTYKDLIA